MDLMLEVPTMTLLSLRTPARRWRARSVLHRLRSLLGTVFRKDHARLEVEDMPDHMKRDLGFLDGRDPRYDREWTR